MFSENGKICEVVLKLKVFNIERREKVMRLKYIYKENIRGYFYRILRIVFVDWT